MDYKTLRSRKQVVSRLAKEEQLKLVKDYQKGLSNVNICRKYNVSESAMYRTLQGHLGRRPSMFRKNKDVNLQDNEKKENRLDIKKDSSKLSDKERIKELEKELKDKEREIIEYKKQVDAVKGFLGNF